MMTAPFHSPTRVKRRLTPPNPASAVADDLGLDPERVRDRDGRGRVQRIVAARHRQGELVDLVCAFSIAITEEDGELRLAVEMIEINEANVGLRIFAICQNAAIFEFPDHCLNHGVIGAHHRKAVEGYVLDEAAECVLHGLECAEVVEMLGVDVGDDGDVGGQLEKRAVRFVRLDHHPVAGAEPRIGAVGIDDAAVDHGGVEAAGVEQRGNERGRRRLSVRSGDSDAAFQPHEFREHFGAPHDRQALGARGDKLGIVALDRGGNDHHVGAVDIFSLVPDRDFHALVAQSLDVGAIGDVGTGHAVAEIGQDFGNAAHANAADADEVHRPDVARQFHVNRPQHLASGAPNPALPGFAAISCRT